MSEQILDLPITYVPISKGSESLCSVNRHLQVSFAHESMLLRYESGDGRLLTEFLSLDFEDRHLSQRTPGFTLRVPIATLGDSEGETGCTVG